MTTWDIVCADVNEWAEGYDGPPFHAVLCDAPYEMREVDIDNLGAQGKGFMGKDWDGSGVSFDPDTWRGIARHLLPGAFLFVFAGTINDDLISVAMRKAGLRKHHKAAYWANGQGFPKSTKICHQLDKAAGKLDERKVIGMKRSGLSMNPNLNDDGWHNANGDETSKHIPVTAPATPLAQTWAGHRYGLQAIKPAVESVLIFQKPYAGKSVDSIVETGAGALWIEGGRIATDDSLMGGQYCGTERQAGNCYGKHRNLPPDAFRHPSGRWPSNLLLAHVPPHTCPTCDGDGCDACGGEGLVGGCVRVGEKRVRGITGGKNPVRGVGIMAEAKGHQTPGRPQTYNDYADPDGLETVADWQCVEGCAVRALGEQSGERPRGWTQGGGKTQVYGSGDNITYRASSTCDTGQYRGYPDKGTAARFFFQAGWSHEIAEQVERAAPVFYCAKASRRERDSGLENFDEQPVRRLSGGEFAHNSITRKVSKNETVTRNPHPTCKPIALAKHLATLLLPPPEYAPRRVLVPFAGSGSEAIGAMLAGWEEIVCVELIQDYCDIAEARLAWWADWMDYTGVDDVKELLRLSNNGKVRREKDAERLV